MEQKDFRDLLLPAAAIIILSASLVFGSRIINSKTVIQAAPSVQYYK